MKLTLDNQKCTGCKLCELACSSSHQNIFNPAKSHLKIIISEDGTNKQLKSCTLCLACVNSCPVGAIGFNNNWLTVDIDQCTSCGVCAGACPQGVIYQDAAGKAAVPDFCRGNPLCAAWCPHQAIELSGVMA
jgi:anaerobic carbon-monoxide dehydrogenase iron sulfur subunit